jgi:hypothetical protein
MTKHQDVAKALNARLSELKHRVAEIDRELHAPLPAPRTKQLTSRIKRRSKRLKNLEYGKTVGLNKR